MVPFGSSYERAQLTASVKILLSLLITPHWRQKATCESVNNNGIIWEIVTE
jgi:hypothetical protein